MKKIEFSSSARKFLIKADKTLAKRILNKIEMLIVSPFSLEVKKLKGEKGLYRIRIGDYRVIFELHGDTILITDIGNRKDIYK